MESQASLQHFSSGLGHIEQDSLRGITSGEIRVDFVSCQKRVAVKCLTCAHRIWVKSKESAGLMTLAWRKSERGVLMGYLISPRVLRSKQCKQVVCLNCVHNLLGVVTESADRLLITLSSRRDGGQDMPILRRQRGDGPWSQSFELTDDVLSFLCQENATTGLGHRPVATTAIQIGDRGMAKGVRPRVKGASEETSTEVSLHIFFFD
jgi:hypothetical protein